MGYHLALHRSQNVTPRSIVRGQVICEMKIMLNEKKEKVDNQKAVPVPL